MTRTAVGDEQVPSGEQCWCCGQAGDSNRMVHLGNHPEVALCLRCARFVAKCGREIEDRDKTGVVVLARDKFRAVRKAVVARGWQNTLVVGPALRWIGRHTP